MSMLWRIFCFIGWHSIEPDEFTVESYWFGRCVHCKSLHQAVYDPCYGHTHWMEVE